MGLSNSDSIELSFVITCRNQADLIESILTNWYKALTTLEIPFEMMVVNKGSRDGSVRVLDHLRKVLPYLRVIHQLPSSETEARLKAFPLTRGKYIFFCPLNDQVLPQELVQAWQNKGVAQVGCLARNSAKASWITAYFINPIKRTLSQLVLSFPGTDPGSPFIWFNRNLIEVSRSEHNVERTFWTQQWFKMVLSLPLQSYFELQIEGYFCPKEGTFKSQILGNICKAFEMLSFCFSVKLKDSNGLSQTPSAETR